MKRIYLDYAASTPVDPAVLGAMIPYFSSVFGNPGSLHREGQEASAAVFRARVQIAKLLGASYGEIVFTGSATEANNLALRGVVNALIQNSKVKYQNDNSKFKNHLPKANAKISHFDFCASHFQPRIIVSAIEHESILETARDLERVGIEIIYLPVSRAGIVDLKKLENSLNERTILVSVMYANNDIGAIQPVAEIGKMIREFRKNDSIFPFFHSDAVQALQYLDCDVNNLWVDLMTFSAHKIYGPKGIGALYVRKVANGKSKMDFPDSIFHSPFPISPIVTGGGQEEGLRSGTENTASIVGFAKAAELARRASKREARRVSALAEYFWSGVKKMYPLAKLNGPAIGLARLPNNLNIAFPGLKAEDMLIKLDLMGVAASTGSACASRAAEPARALSAIGLNDKAAFSSLRFTLGRPTSRADIDKSLKVVKNILYE